MSNKFFSNFEDFYGSGEVDMDAVVDTTTITEEESIHEELTTLEESMTKVYSTESITLYNRENSEKEFYTLSKKLIKKFVGYVNKYRLKYEKQYKISESDIMNLKKNNFSLKSSKLNSNEFKSTQVNDTPDYLQVNRRLALYNNTMDIISNRFTEILMEPVTADNGYGTILEDLVHTLKLQGFEVKSAKESLIMSYNNIVDIRPAFNHLDDVSLKELSYGTNDVISFTDRITGTLSKLDSKKDTYFKRLTTNPGKYSNVPPLFVDIFNAHNNNKDRVNKTDAIHTRLKRLSLMANICHSVCGYALQQDFETISNLSNIAINVQQQ